MEQKLFRRTPYQMMVAIGLLVAAMFFFASPSVFADGTKADEDQGVKVRVQITPLEEPTDLPIPPPGGSTETAVPGTDDSTAEVPRSSPDAPGASGAPSDSADGDIAVTGADIAFAVTIGIILFGGGTAVVLARRKAAA